MSGVRRLVVEADGGSRGNPGVAGFGALVREERRVLRELAAPLGRVSNNVAEYTGLIVGLRAAHEEAAGEPVRVEVRMDSKLVVEQMSGRWKIKHADMQRLAVEAREVVRAIEADGGSVSYEWIPRAQNKAADALSNEGMDGHHVDRVPGAAPGGGSGPAVPDGGSVPRDEASAVAPPPGWRDGIGGRAAPSEAPEATGPSAAADEVAAPVNENEARAEDEAGVAQVDDAEAAAPNRAAAAMRTRGTAGPAAPVDATDPGDAPVRSRRSAIAPASTAGPDLSPPVRIVLVRHGVTEYTRHGRLDGRGGGDPALTAEGIAQAEAAGRGVASFLGRDGLVRVVTSSLQRARQTGAYVAAGLGVTAEAEADLDELCFGAWEGRTVAEITREDPAALQRSRTAEDVPPPGGESYAQLAERVLPAVRRLVDEVRDAAAAVAASTDARAGGPRSGDGRATRAGIGGPSVSPALVLVTHRGPIGVILADVLGMDRPHVWRLASAPCSLTSIRSWRDGGVVVEFVNDTSHLR